MNPVHTISNALDEIANLIDQQELTAALGAIEKLEKTAFDGMGVIEAGRLQLCAAEALYYSGRNHEALDHATKAIESFEPGDAHSLYGHAKRRRGYIHLRFGRFLKAEEDFRGALAAFGRVNDREGELRACNCLVKSAYSQGKFQAAKEYLQRVLDLCEETGDMHRRRRTEGNLGRILTLLGDFAGARPLLDLDAATIETMDPHGRCNWHVSNCYLLLLIREFDQAATHLEQVRLLAAEHSFAREIGIHHEYAGEMAFWEGDRDKAESHYREAIKIGMEIAPEGDLISQSYRLLAELQVDRPGRCRRSGTLYAIYPGGYLLPAEGGCRGLKRIYRFLPGSGLLDPDAVGVVRMERAVPLMGQ